jgi:hypothetical protein
MVGKLRNRQSQCLKFPLWIPLYNEAENVLPLCYDLRAAMQGGAHVGRRLRRR